MQLNRSAIIALCLALCALVSACAKPELLDSGPAIGVSSLNDTEYTTADGERLQVSRWAASSPRAVFVAVHGFNEYAGSFQLPGPWFSRQGISVYAYDQRGFGRGDAARLGKWAGGDVHGQGLERLCTTGAPATPGRATVCCRHLYGGCGCHESVC